MPRAETERIFGLATYVQKYGAMGEGISLDESHPEFDDWRVRVPFDDGVVNVLCCPEDLICEADVEHDPLTCCERCVAPVCTECSKQLFQRKPQMPPAALANDMMIYYAPSELYEFNATVMEMICASVCITSMICFTLEKKYRGNRALDETMHANQYRMAARGNVTSFPLPWGDLLQQLHTGENMEELSDLVSLPRTGEDLTHVVSVLLKTADADDSEKGLARLIHQAMVRRDVVVKLIASMKRRGHRAYKHVQMEQVRERAELLPQHGVPPEIIRLLPLDNLLDKIQMQKSATPVATPQSVEEAAATLDVLRPNGVVLEKSSQDEIDVNAQRNAALHNLLEKLKKSHVPKSSQHLRTERLEVKSGNEMIDQFQPWYFGVVFSFHFRILHRHARATTVHATTTV